MIITSRVGNGDVVIIRRSIFAIKVFLLRYMFDIDYLPSNINLMLNLDRRNLFVLKGFEFNLKCALLYI